MNRYVVSFREVRRYEMTLEAPDGETAILWARRGPENPLWISVDLEGYEATELQGDAP